jgi:DNA-binding SARP family transcriptional activator
MIGSFKETTTAMENLNKAIITIKALFTDAKVFYTTLASACLQEIEKAHTEIDAEFSSKEEEEPGERERAYNSVIYNVEGKTVTHSR